MDERERRNIETAWRMYAGERGERHYIADDIVWHVPGHNPVSGDYSGRDAYLSEMAARMAPLDRWEFEVHDVMANGDHVMTTVRVVGERRGMHVDLRAGHLMRMNDQGQVAEGWGFTSDQDELDAFFSA